jgi:hypothetical protein
MITDFNAELRDLLDKQACIELITRYSRALDWLDDDALKNVFWPDAEIDFGFFKGRADQFMREIMELEHGLARRWHMTTNPLVRITGNTAEGESYGLAAGIAIRNGFERRHGEWRIVRRVYVADWQQSFEVAASAENKLVSGINWSNGFNPGHPLFRKL